MPDKKTKDSAKCPLCTKPVQDVYAPFCSAGCKDRDLLKWLGDGYAIPGPVALGDEEDAPDMGANEEG